MGVYCFNCGAHNPSNFFATETILSVHCEECDSTYNVDDINGSFGWEDR